MSAERHNQTSRRGHLTDFRFRNDPIRVPYVGVRAIPDLTRAFRLARINMNEPRLPSRIDSDDRAHGPVRRFARLTATGALALAIASALRPQAKAQQADGAMPPAPSTAAMPAPQTDSASKFDVSVTAAIASDYNFRGYTLSDHKPSVSTNFEATYNILFVDVDAASVRIPMLAQLQVTDYAGFRPVFGPLTVETGVAYYSYPGSAIDISYPEYYVAPSYALTSRFTIRANAYYAPDYSRTGAWENYDSIDAKYTFDSGLAISGELGRQSFGTTKATAMETAHKLPDYTYWNLGFSYTYKALTFDLRYFATTLSKQSCFLITGTGQPAAGSNGCDPALVATLSWNTGLSGLK
jgi:uncharacterized protein (TIGR02001 family)